MVLLDANVLVYYLDETSDNHAQTIGLLQKLVDDDEQLVTSHRIIEEVLFVLSKLSPDTDFVRAVKRITKLPGLILVEPSPSIDFALRFAALSQKLNTGVNDALILQLMLDAGIAKLFSYDKKLLKQAHALHIEPIA